MTYQCPSCGESIRSLGGNELLFSDEDEEFIVRDDLVVFTNMTKSSGETIWMCPNERCSVKRIDASKL